MEQTETLRAIQYTGTKTVYAAPLTRTEAATYLGRNLKSENSNEEEGYLVRYNDNYQSWSPKTTFEQAYKPSATFLDRMHIELDELKQRIVRLNNFILTKEYRNLNHSEQAMLGSQLSHMHDYYNVLANRIDYYDSIK